MDGRPSLAQSPATLPAPPAPGREGCPPPIVTENGLFAVTLADYYCRSHRGENPADLLSRAKTLEDILKALGFVLPREAYFPDPNQHAHRVGKTLTIPPKLRTEAFSGRDIPVRFYGARTCWLYIRDLFVRPLNQTAVDSLVLRFSIQNGPSRMWIDFCSILGHANDIPGEYAPPQVVMVPPETEFRIDLYNKDQYSEAILGVESFQWLVPGECGTDTKPNVKPAPTMKGGPQGFRR